MRWRLCAFIVVTTSVAIMHAQPVKLWHTPGSTNGVWDVAVSPDGDHYATALVGFISVRNFNQIEPVALAQIPDDFPYFATVWFQSDDTIVITATTYVDSVAQYKYSVSEGTWFGRATVHRARLGGETITALDPTRRFALLRYSNYDGSPDTLVVEDLLSSTILFRSHVKRYQTAVRFGRTIDRVITGLDRDITLNANIVYTTPSRTKIYDLHEVGNETIVVIVDSATNTVDVLHVDLDANQLLHRTTIDAFSIAPMILESENGPLWIRTSDTTITAYDIATRTVIRTINLPDKSFVCMAQTPSGAIVVGTSDGACMVNRDVSNGFDTLIAPNQGVLAITQAFDGRVFVARTKSSLRELDRLNGSERILPLLHSTTYDSLADVAWVGASEYSQRVAVLSESALTIRSGDDLKNIEYILEREGGLASLGRWEYDPKPGIVFDANSDSVVVGVHLRGIHGFSEFNVERKNGRGVDTTITDVGYGIPAKYTEEFMWAASSDGLLAAMGRPNEGGDVYVRTPYPKWGEARVRLFAANGHVLLLNDGVTVAVGQLDALRLVNTRDASDDRFYIVGSNCIPLAQYHNTTDLLVFNPEASTLLLCDVANGNIKWTRSVLPGVSCAIVDRDDKWFALGYKHGTIELFATDVSLSVEGSPNRAAFAGKSTVSVHPNPATDAIHVTVSNALQREDAIDVLDVVGRISLSAQIMSACSTIDFDVRSLPNGRYFIRLRQGGVVSTTPIVIVR